MERIHLIANLEAAGGKARDEYLRIEEYLKTSGIKVETSFSEYAGHSVQLAKEAFKTGATRIVSFGGDGTHYEVLNGILRGAEERFGKSAFEFSSGEKATLPVLGIVSIGSGNDFRRTLKLPKNAVDAMNLALKGLPKQIDVGFFEYINLEGKKDSRYFLNIMSGGFSGTVTMKANRGKKLMLGKMVYVGALLNTLLFSLIPDGLLKHESKKLDGKFFEFDIANGKFFGGGMMISPYSEIDDGYLNIALFRDYKGIEVLFKIKKLFDGSIIKENRLYYEKTKEVFVEFTPPAIVEADGEVVGYTPVKARVVERAIRVIGP